MSEKNVIFRNLGELDQHKFEFSQWLKGSVAQELTELVNQVRRNPEKVQILGEDDDLVDLVDWTVHLLQIARTLEGQHLKNKLYDPETIDRFYNFALLLLEQIRVEKEVELEVDSEFTKTTRELVQEFFEKALEQARSSEPRDKLAILERTVPLLSNEHWFAIKPREREKAGTLLDQLWTLLQLNFGRGTSELSVLSETTIFNLRESLLPEKQTVAYQLRDLISFCVFYLQVDEVGGEARIREVFEFLYSFKTARSTNYSLLFELLEEFQQRKKVSNKRGVAQDLYSLAEKWELDQH